MIYNDYFDKTQKFIYDYLESLENIPEPLYSAMKYSVLNGGKRLRPILVLLGANLHKADNDAIQKIAIAVELIHCYSLVHDDLPSMDNDTLRRGNPTTHIKYGVAMGILTGDALLNQAFELLNEVSLLDTNFKKSAYYISMQSGAKGMIAGQCIDVTYNENTNIEIILDMYCLKTSCLFKAGLVGGALAVGASKEEIQALESFAHNLGIAFQISDDILDVTSTSEVLGKDIGSDDKNNKPTFLSKVGLDKAKEYKKLYENKARDAVKNLKIKDDLNQILDMIINRKK